MNLESMLRRNVVRYLVQRDIFCQVSGEVLDIDTCWVILDPDGDPHSVVSPAVGQAILNAGEAGLAPGYVVRRSKDI